MRITFIIHGYFPKLHAGAESMVRSMCRYLKPRHELKIVISDPAFQKAPMYSYEGVPVIPKGEDGWDNWIEGADALITHLGEASWTINICNIIKKPVYFISHNTHPYEAVKRFRNCRVIYNSHAMKEILKYDNKSIVVHPSVNYREWAPSEFHHRKYITLVNMNSNKGAALFLKIAAAMPGHQFMGIKGSYDTQLTETLPNLTIIDNGSMPMDTVYRHTKVLLVPSRYESWSMCATEAMCCGIPVIYNPTFGLTENVGKAGIAIKDASPDGTIEIKGGEYQGIDPDTNLCGWVKAIKSLDNPKTYQKYSTLALNRAKELDPEKELAELEKFLINGNVDPGHF